MTHIHYTKWPDHDVPTAAHELLYLYYKIQQQCKGKLLVHCSAGVGRTGTYIALHNLLQQRKEGEVDILKCVAKLREQRYQMVQTVQQYRYGAY